MAVELILLKDVEGVGREGDTMRVAEGYARNYLIPKKLAAPITAAALRKIEKTRQERESTLRKEIDAARETARRIGELSVSIARKTADGDKLFGSVTQADIADALKQHGVALDKKLIHMEDHIRELGVFQVPIKLHQDVDASLKVWVVEE